jgi:hypothetical protein
MSRDYRMRRARRDIRAFLRLTVHCRVSEVKDVTVCDILDDHFGPQNLRGETGIGHADHLCCSPPACCSRAASCGRSGARSIFAPAVESVINFRGAITSQATLLFGEVSW